MDFIHRYYHCGLILRLCQRDKAVSMKMNWSEKTFSRLVCDLCASMNNENEICAQTNDRRKKANSQKSDDL